MSASSSHLRRVLLSATFAACIGGLAATLDASAQSAAAVVSHYSDQAPREVRAAHLREVERLKCGDPYVVHRPRYDAWHRIDLDGDSVNEHVVFVGMEGFAGGNYNEQYLIVYRYVDPVWFAATTLRVGGRGTGGVDGRRVMLANGVLSAEGLFYAEGEGFCCPSVSGSVRFRVGEGGAIEFLDARSTRRSTAQTNMSRFVGNVGRGREAPLGCRTRAESLELRRRQ